MQPLKRLASLRTKFVEDENALLDLSRPMAVIGTVIGAVVVTLLIASVIAIYFGAIADVNQNLSDENVTTGNDTADTIMRVFPIVVGVVAVVALVGLILAALELRRNGMG